MRVSKLAVAMVAMAFCSVANANPLYFTGTATTGNLTPQLSGTFVLSNLAYTAGAGQNAVVNSATLALSMAGFSTATFVDIKGGLGASKNRIQVNSLNTLLINVNWTGDATNSIGTQTSELRMTINSTKSVAANVASQANIDFLVANAGSVTATFDVNGQGSLPDSTYDLTGLSSVPEPSSWALLAGVGMVVGRRYLRRRAASAKA